MSKMKKMAFLGGLTFLGFNKEDKREPDREVNRLGDTGKKMYRFYEDGTWTHKHGKGVVFTCLATNTREAKKKYQDWLD